MSPALRANPDVGRSPPYSLIYVNLSLVGEHLKTRTQLVDPISWQVAAAFLLFPQTIDVDVNTSNTRERSVRSVQDNSLDMATGFKDNSLNMATGFCAHSSSTVCKLLNAVLISEVSYLSLSMLFVRRT